MTPMKLRLSLAAALIAAVLPVSVRAEVRAKYKITDLGPGVARAVNNVGQVLLEGAVYDRGTFTNIGNLGGGGDQSMAISDAGVVVGSSMTAEGQQRAFVWANGAMTDLLGLPSIAFGVNSAGDVVGDAEFSIPGRQAFLYSGGAVTVLSSVWCCSRAHGINELGQIVGYDVPPGTSYQRGVIWTGGVPEFMGTLRPSDEISEAYAINDRGEAVGHSTTVNVSTRAFLYRNGALVDISPVGATQSAIAFDINNSGQAVGWYSDGNTTRAFLYAGGVTIDLNTLASGSGNWLLSGALGINDAGQIVGFGFRNGAQHAFLATPQ